MSTARAALLALLVVALPANFYWYLLLGDTQLERQAWFVRGMMATLALVLAVQALPGGRLRGPCIGTALLGLVGAGVALANPQRAIYDPATGAVQLAIVLSALMIAATERPGRTRRLGIALAGSTTFGLAWFIWLRFFMTDPGGPELALASRALGTEYAPAIPVSVSAILAVWARPWSP